MFSSIAAFAALLLACVPATWAGKLTDHSCYTDLTASSTHLKCYKEGLSGAFALPVQKLKKCRIFDRIISAIFDESLT